MGVVKVRGWSNTRVLALGLRRPFREVFSDRAGRGFGDFSESLRARVCLGRPWGLGRVEMREGCVGHCGSGILYGSEAMDPREVREGWRSSKLQ